MQQSRSEGRASLALAQAQGILAGHGTTPWADSVRLIIQEWGGGSERIEVAFCRHNRLVGGQLHRVLATPPGVAARL